MEKAVKDKKKEKGHIRKRHFIFFRLGRWLLGWILRLIYNFTYDPFKLEKGQNYFILSNHQTLLDPALLCLSFKAPIYFMATDTIFKKTFVSGLLRYCFAPIAKKKGVSDVASILNCRRIANEGGNIALFPEGNRAWADFQFYISPAIVKMIRVLALPVLIYNFEGGFGTDPRWSNGLRRGRFHGGVKDVITVEEVKAMSDGELFERVVSGLRVIDSESGERYRSHKRAERLERELFVCPICGGISSLKSDGNYISCEKCGLKIEYTEDLKLKSDNPDFKFIKLLDWYSYQLEFIKTLDVSGAGVIYQDKDVDIVDSTGDKKVILSRGEMYLYNEKIVVGDVTIDLNEVTIATVVGARKLVITTPDKTYAIRGDERFNALKYVLTLNVLPTSIKDEKYYSLELMM